MTIRVKQLYNYPLKSTAGHQADEMDVTMRGFLNDRRYMLVEKETGKLVSQRTKGCAVLARWQVNADANGDIYIMPHETRDMLKVSEMTEGTVMDVVIHGQVTQGLVASDNVNSWISEHLGHDVQLVRQTDDLVRGVDTDFGRIDDRVSFADGFPFLIANEASLDALQPHFDAAAGYIGMERFRPNIVLEGADAFAEDTWDTIRIGKIWMSVVKPCSRCIVTTIDQDTGERASAEPLRTLGQLRKGQGGAFFGQNAVPRIMGKIKVGDEVEIHTFRREPSPLLNGVKLK